jgi:starch synthase
MSKKKVLIVTQEMQPYTDLTEASAMVRKLSPYLQNKDMEIRVLMPRYGTINERRHRLHEVVRLSGMNIIVDDDDYPLIIKVASLPEARMQVYFLDNDDFFKRKFVFENAEKEAFEDNADRAVFFSKGVIETVKKFGWAPDIIHCHGWMSALVPFYLRTAYQNEPLFQQSKIIYSLYEMGVERLLGDQFVTKASINNLTEEDLAAFTGAENAVDIHKGAMRYSDALIKGNESFTDHIIQLLATTDLPVLEHQTPESLATVVEFYHSLLPEEVEN